MVLSVHKWYNDEYSTFYQFSQALLALRGHPGVASWLSHEGLTKFEGRLGHELVPPGAVLRQGGRAAWGVKFG